MTRFVSPLQGVISQRPARKRTWGERTGFVVYAFAKGALLFGGKLAALSGFIGGSVLVYAIFVAHLGLPWALLIASLVLLVVFGLGAYHLWDGADQAAWRYAPTWETCQARADILLALTEEYRYVGDERFIDATDLPRERRVGFRKTYMAGHMTQARADYDRAAAAGYPPAFDRDRIGSAEIEDVVDLAAAFEAAASRWRADERGNPPGGSAITPESGPGTAA